MLTQAEICDPTIYELTLEQIDDVSGAGETLNKVAHTAGYVTGGFLVFGLAGALVGAAVVTLAAAAA